MFDLRVGSGRRTSPLHRYGSQLGPRNERHNSELAGPTNSVRNLEYTRDIDESGHHLLGPINDILEPTKIEAGRSGLDEETVAFDAIVSACLAVVKQRAEDGGVTSDIVARWRGLR